MQLHHPPSPGQQVIDHAQHLGSLALNNRQDRRAVQHTFKSVAFRPLPLRLRVDR